MKLFQTAASQLCTALLLTCAASMPAWAQTPAQAATELGQAYKAIQEKNYSDAEQRLLALREKSPDDLYVLLNLGVVYQMTGRTDQAVALYERVAGDKGKHTNSAVTSASEQASDRLIGRSPADIARYNLRTLGK